MIVLVVIAWFALKPHVFRVVAQPDAVAEPDFICPCRHIPGVLQIHTPLHSSLISCIIFNS